MDKMDLRDLPPLVYGMDGDKYLYCEFATQDKFSRPGAYSQECRRKNQKTSMWVDGEMLRPFHVYTLGQNADLLECSPLEHVKSTHCSEGWRVYTVCSFECKDGFEAIVETVECVVAEPLDNITAVWTSLTPCRELPSRKNVTKVDKPHSRGRNNNSAGPRPEGGKTDTAELAKPGKVKEEDGGNGKTIIIAVSCAVVVGCIVLGVVGRVYWKWRKRQGNSDAGSSLGPSVISSAESIRKPGDGVILASVVADGVVADGVVADGVVADGGVLHDGPAMGLSDRHIFSMDSMSHDSDPQTHFMQYAGPCEGELNEASPLEQMEPLLGDARRTSIDKPRVLDLCDASMKEFEELGFNAYRKLMENLEYHQEADKASTLYGFVLENYKALGFRSRRAVEVHQNNASYRGEGDTPCEYFLKHLSSYGEPIRTVLTYFSVHSKEATQAILEVHDCEACREEFGFDESEL